MEHRLFRKNFVPLSAAVQRRESLRRDGKRVVLTNGCFDLLHTGHVHFLEQAASLGDSLFVAVNGDESVKQLKGPTRPVQSTAQRAFLLGALRFVDTVFAFETQRLHVEIRELAPDFYCKAGDYCLETLDPSEREALLAVGADIRFLPFLEGFSTTALIARIAAASAAFGA